MLGEPSLRQRGNLQSWNKLQSWKLPPAIANLGGAAAKRACWCATVSRDNAHRASDAVPAIGHNARPSPTTPTEKVQMISTRPELPVRRCAIQAMAISTESDIMIATSAS